MTMKVQGAWRPHNHQVVLVPVSILHPEGLPPRIGQKDAAWVQPDLALDASGGRDPQAACAAPYPCEIPGIAIGWRRKWRWTALGR
jgi:hypothetical protein